MADGVNPEYFRTEISWWRWPLRWLHSTCLRPVQIWRQKKMYCLVIASRACHSLVSLKSLKVLFALSIDSSFQFVPCRPGKTSQRFLMNCWRLSPRHLSWVATRRVWLEVFRWAWFQGHQCWLFSYLVLIAVLVSWQEIHDLQKQLEDEKRSRLVQEARDASKSSKISNVSEDSA